MVDALLMCRVFVQAYTYLTGPLFIGRFVENDDDFSWWVRVRSLLLSGRLCI